MRSSLDCCRRATAACRSWTSVCSWTMSLLTAKAGGAARASANRAAGQNRVCLKARWSIIGVVPQVRAVRRRVKSERRRICLATWLAVERELGAAILLPACLGLFGAELLLLAVADDADAAGGDAGVDQRGLGGVGAILAQGQVVFGGAAVVAVAADDDADVGMRDQVGRRPWWRRPDLRDAGCSCRSRRRCRRRSGGRLPRSPCRRLRAPDSAGAVGATGTRTVTRTLASAVPPSPLATRWKLVEVDGETVWVPLTLTGPMPSMETEVALVVRQLRTTDWPRSMASGSAVRLAVGAAVGASAVGPRLAGFTGLVFLWQPVMAARPTARQKRGTNRPGPKRLKLN